MCVCNNYSECCSYFDSFSFSPNIIIIIIIITIVNLTCLCVANSVITIINGSKCSYGNFYHAVCIPHRVSPYYIDHMTMYVHTVLCCPVLWDLLKLCISSSELHMTYGCILFMFDECSSNL